MKKKNTLTEFGMGFLTMANTYFKSTEKSDVRILQINLWNPAYLPPETLKAQMASEAGQKY